MQRVGPVRVSPVEAQLGEPAAIYLDARGLHEGAFLYADEADRLADQLRAAAAALRAGA
jgi:hypothetical protein